MSKLTDSLLCKTCGQSLNQVGDQHDQEKALEDSSRCLEVTCSHCGTVNAVSFEGKTLAETETATIPINPEEMKEAIIEVLKQLYPMRTGYNGGHLAHLRDPDPDLFFPVLHQMEKEGVIEYNDTQIAMRLSDEFMHHHSVILSEVKNL